MTQHVDADQIEDIVGIPRQRHRHVARAVSAEQTVYILHPQECLDMTADLTMCTFSETLDNGIDMDVWAELQDRPVFVERQLQPHSADFKLVPQSVASAVLPYRRING